MPFYPSPHTNQMKDYLFAPIHLATFIDCLICFYCFAVYPYLVAVDIVRSMYTDCHTSSVGLFTYCPCSFHLCLHLWVFICIKTHIVHHLGASMLDLYPHIERFRITRRTKFYTHTIYINHLLHYKIYKQ